MEGFLEEVAFVLGILRVIGRGLFLVAQWLRVHFPSRGPGCDS